ncbi:Pro-Pol polyprotein, partial [Trichinella sp. T9]
LPFRPRQIESLQKVALPELELCSQSFELSDVAEAVVKSCVPCAMTNAGHSRYPPGRRLRGDRPGAYWEVDFTEVKPAKYGNKYLLVFIDTFSGWVEAYPRKKETANVVVKKILEEIFPRFGIPKVIGSD